MASENMPGEGWDGGENEQYERGVEVWRNTQSEKSKNSNEMYFIQSYLAKTHTHTHAAYPHAS